MARDYGLWTPPGAYTLRIRHYFCHNLGVDILVVTETGERTLLRLLAWSKTVPRAP